MYFSFIFMSQILVYFKISGMKIDVKTYINMKI